LSGAYNPGRSMIANLKDNQGKPYSVKEIVPETILFNYLLHPQPWRVNSEEKVALIVKSKENRYLKERKGFKEWHYINRFLKKYKGPVTLVKFNKFKAMETLPEMSPGKEYELTLSGELKNGKRFKGTTHAYPDVAHTSFFDSICQKPEVQGVWQKDA
jgi:hypothetical protein